MAAPSLATEDPEKAKSNMGSLRLLTLLALCFVDGTYTVLRRYSRGVLREKVSFNEVLLLSEVFKLAFAVWTIRGGLQRTRTAKDEDGRVGTSGGGGGGDGSGSLPSHLFGLLLRSRKMFLLASIYGAGNVLSYVALRRVGAGTFVVIAQAKTLTTALFSSVMLRRRYSWTKWRALVLLVAGVVLFVLPTLEENRTGGSGSSNLDEVFLVDGVLAEIVVVFLSGYASIYFEKAIKSDSDQCGIWERNFQLSVWSIPLYILMVITYPREDGDGGYFSNWSPLALLLSVLGATGGLLVALSIKYGDSVLKTLAISGSIIYAAVVDHNLLGGALTSQMAISAVVTIIGILNYTFDATPEMPAEHFQEKKDPTSPQRRKSGDATGGGGGNVEDGWVENESQLLV